MKRITLILLITIAISSCIREDTSGCCADIRVAFYLDDAYESGTYDSRIGNDACLYLFRNGTLTDIHIIPYENISNGGVYSIKTENRAGRIDLVAWAIPEGEDPSLLPVYEIGDSFNDLYTELDLINNADENQGFMPCSYIRHLGVVLSVDNNRSSIHQIGMFPAACRIEVNVKDMFGDFSDPQTELSIGVNGVMRKMNLQKQGMGNHAVVHTALRALDTERVLFSSGRFGVLPSAQDQVVSIDILKGDTKIVTLTVPQNNLPQGAKVGGLMIFDYQLGQTYFNITVDGFTHKIETVDQM